MLFCSYSIVHYIMGCDARPPQRQQSTDRAEAQKSRESASLIEIESLCALCAHLNTGER